jgi:hypothetical protein
VKELCVTFFQLVPSLVSIPFHSPLSPCRHSSSAARARGPIRPDGGEALGEDVLEAGDADLERLGAGADRCLDPLDLARLDAIGVLGERLDQHLVVKVLLARDLGRDASRVAQVDLEPERRARIILVRLAGLGRALVRRRAFGLVLAIGRPRGCGLVLGLAGVSAPPIRTLFARGVLPRRRAVGRLRGLGACQAGLAIGEKRPQGGHVLHGRAAPALLPVADGRRGLADRLRDRGCAKPAGRQGSEDRRDLGPVDLGGVHQRDIRTERARIARC